MSADKVNEVKNKDTNQELVEDNNVDKIRDILFGGNMREYDKRFARLEDRLNADIDRLSQDVFKRFDTLDNFIKNEFEDLNARLHNEKTERKQDREDTKSELSGFEKQTTNRFADVEQQTSAEARTIRSTLHEQGNELLELIRTTRDELASTLQQESRDLQDSKVARTDLAELLSEVALRLNKEAESE